MSAKPRGKYTGKACQECRRRRAKCNGTKPSCSRCLQYSISCQYSDAEDGRRPASKSYVTLLRQRIERLEQTLQRHGIDPGANPSSNDGLSRVSDVPSVMDDLCEDMQGQLSLDDALNFDQDGEMRYFGPTSGRLQFRDSSSSPEENDLVGVTGLTPDPAFDILSTVQDYTDPALIIPGLNELNEFGVPETLQDHLIHLYFTWDQPWFPIVDEVLFRESRTSRGRYWSPLLHLSILALGSRYAGMQDTWSDSGDSNTAGKVFLEQAKPLLHREMEHPSLTTLQAIGIIGTVYFAMGADAAGWLHHGMANRLSLDMGLNIDPAKFKGVTKMSAREMRLRRQIYWTLYFHDKSSASYTGRICSMLDQQGAVDVPSESDQIDDMETNTTTPKCIQKALIPLQRAMISISRIQEHVLLSLWAPQPIIKNHQRAALLRSCLLDLRTWFYDLPSELRIDRPNDVPHAYTLHMVYHTTRILLARPFLTTTSRENPAMIEVDETIKLAQSICSESAEAICLVGQKYRNVFGGFHLSPITATHCTLSASLVLLEEPDCSATRSRLAVCLTVLGELSKVWSPAKHIGNNLRRLCASLSRDIPPSKQIDDDGTEGLVVDAALQAGVEITNLTSEELERSIQFTHDHTLYPWNELPDDYGFLNMLNGPQYFGFAD